jgi:phosphatidylglycerophosphate synthase
MLVRTVQWVVIGLTVAAVLLVGWAVSTVRRPAAPVPDLAGFFDRWSTLHGGYDPGGSRLVGGWLAGVYRLGRPLAVRGVAPDVITIWGLWAAMVVVALVLPGGRWPLAAVPVVVVSGWLDNLDGCVAVLTDRATRWGMVLDSVVDRLADGAYLLALWRLGAPGPAVAAAGAALGLLEYTRARAGIAGMAEIGVVTVGERPTRIILSAGSLWTAGLFPERAALVAGLGAALTAGVSVLGLGQLIRVVRRNLSRPLE